MPERKQDKRVFEENPRWKDKYRQNKQLKNPL